MDVTLGNERVLPNVTLVLIFWSKDDVTVSWESHRCLQYVVQVRWAHGSKGEIFLLTVYILSSDDRGQNLTGCNRNKQANK